jgi:hypothetical protein
VSVGARPPASAVVDLERLRRAADATLRNAVAHLAGAGQWNRLHALLLGSTAWREAKLERFGSDVSYLEDLRLALDALQERSNRPSPGQVATAVELVMARHGVEAAGDLHSDVDLQTLAWLGRDTHAIAYARTRLVATGSPEGLCAVWRVLRERGRPNRLLLAEARDAVRALEPGARRTRLQVEIAESLLAIGEAEQGLGLLDAAFEESCGETEVQMVVTPTQAARVLIGVQGQEPISQPLAESVHDEPFHHLRLGNIVEALVRCRQFGRAAAAIPAIDSPAARVRLWGVLSRALRRARRAEASDRARADGERDASAIEDPGRRAHARAHLAARTDCPQRLLDAIEDDLQAATERAREAIRVGNQFALGRSQRLDRLNAVIGVENVCAVARALHRAGRRREAVAALSTAEGLVADLNAETDDEDLLGETPVLYIEQYAGARRVSSVARFSRREDAVGALAVACAAVGQRTRARALLADLGHERVRLACGYRIARLMARAGLAHEAIDVASTVPACPLFETDGGPDLVLLTRFNHDAYRRAATDSYADVARTAAAMLLARGRLVECEAFIPRAVEQYEPPTGREGATSGSTRDGRAGLRGELDGLLAHAYARAGRASEALELLASSHVRAAAAQTESIPFVVMRLIEAYARYDQVETAAALIPLVEIHSLQTDAHGIVAAAEAERRGPAGVRAGIRRLLDAREAGPEQATPYLRAGSLRIAAKRLAAIGAAREAAESIVAASEVAAGLKEPALKSDAFRLLAEAIHGIGDSEAVDAAYAVAADEARAVVPRWGAIRLYAALGESQHRTGRSASADGAFRAAVHELGLRYPGTHSADASALSLALARTDRFDLAVSVASTICDDPRYRAQLHETIHGLVAELTRAGRWAEASTLALTLTEPGDAARALCTIARGLVDAARDVEAARTLEFATSLGRRTTDPERRAGIAVGVAIIRARRGELDAALGELSALEDAEVRRLGLSAVQEEEIGRGNVVRGVAQWRGRSVEQLLERLVAWAPAFERIDPTLPPGVLTRALRIAGWYRPWWSRVHAAVIGSRVA